MILTYNKATHKYINTQKANHVILTYNKATHKYINTQKANHVILTYNKATHKYINTQKANHMILNYDKEVDTSICNTDLGTGLTAVKVVTEIVSFAL